MWRSHKSSVWTKMLDIPIEEQVHVPRVQKVRKLIHREVHVPHDQNVPRQIDRPQVAHIDENVDVPVEKQVHVPHGQKVQTSWEIEVLRSRCMCLMYRRFRNTCRCAKFSIQWNMTSLCNCFEMLTSAWQNKCVHVVMIFSIQMQMLIDSMH